MKSFKPYYNWNTFNTILGVGDGDEKEKSFKPYYNWNTFNTMMDIFRILKQVKF